MTLPSQFSLEEENFYKDIQDLVKKSTQNEKELSLLLERYKDLLARADLDDETFIINFAKAGLILEASAKVYGIKVDNLWINLEHVLESLKNKGPLQANKKKLNGENDGDLDVNGCDDVQEDDDKRKGLGLAKRRKKLGDVLFSSDDFLEIDNVTGLLGKNMNETDNNNERKIKLCEKFPNMFIKNKKKRKKIDVCLNKCLDDKDIIRVRDWVISAECLLIKEIYTQLPESIFSLSNASGGNEVKDFYSSDLYNDDDNVRFGDEVSFVQESIKLSSNFKDEKNNNLETIGIESVMQEGADHEKINSLQVDSLTKELNISKESDLAKFPNVLERINEECLIDVDEVFRNPPKFQEVTSKKLRTGKINKLVCQLCLDKKLHKKKRRKCLENKKIECLDTFFSPHVQPTLLENQFIIITDEELHSVYKAEAKLIEQLKKVNSCKNTLGALYPNKNVEDLSNFLGFDGFDNCFIKKPESLDEDELSGESVLCDRLEDDDGHCEDHIADVESELPLPVVENHRTSNLFKSNNAENNSNENLATSESEYQKLVNEELKEHYAAKSSFAKSKELGMKVSKWFEMISDKIKLSQKRGALNMKYLAHKIMNSFPPQSNCEKPVMKFQNLVSKLSQRDIPRYFFACLQLANEGNLEIGKSSPRSLATDCMVITQLQPIAGNYETENHSITSPMRDLNSSRTIIVQRKRNLSKSPSVSEGMVNGKKKKKQKIIKTCKRPKNFNSIENIKRRRCSLSSVDSLISE